MSFGKTIKKLRREHDMTQERLAEILSISPQAISRWETDMAMPDISLILPLCNLFDVSADMLLGIDIQKKKEQVDQICKEANKYYSRGYNEEARKILEDGLRQYPDNLDIIYHLMYLSSFQNDCTGDRKYLEEAIKWGERILSKSTNDQHRHGAMQILCFSYKDVGRKEEAVKMAESMPHMVCCRESLLCRIHDGDEAYYAKQCYMSGMIQALSNGLCSMQTRLDSGELAYTEDERAVLHEKRITLLHLFFENGDFGFYHTHLCSSHITLAFHCANKGEDDKALAHLEAAAEHSIRFDTAVDEEPTSLVFRGMKGGSWSTGNNFNDSAFLLGRMKEPVFDRIRERDAFIGLQNRLLEHAGKWKVE